MVFRLFLLLALSTGVGRAEVVVNKTADLVVDAEALTIDGNIHKVINGLAYQQNALMTFKGYHYVNWYDKNRHVCLARRQLPDGEWEIIRLTDYVFGAGDKQYRAHDSHNNISMGISPLDGRIHLAFDHHMHPMNYRVSLKGAATEPERVAWTPELFAPTHSILGKTELCKKINPRGLLTYPRFIITADDTLQLFYRAGNRKYPEVRVICDYDHETGEWSGPRPIIADNGYTNYATRYGDDGLFHLFFHWRGSGKLCYLYTEDQGASWRDNEGKVLLKAGDNRYIRRAEADKASVITTKQAPLVMLGGQYMDSKNRPHQIVWHIPDRAEIPDPEVLDSPWGRKIARYHHYWRDDDGDWQRNVLPMKVGNRAKILLDANDNAYVIYMANRSNEANLGISLKKSDLVIATASAESHWTDWKIIHREPGPFLSQATFDHTRWNKDEVLSVYVQDSSDSDYIFAPPDIPKSPKKRSWLQEEPDHQADHPTHAAKNTRVLLREGHNNNKMKIKQAFALLILVILVVGAYAETDQITIKAVIRDGDDVLMAPAITVLSEKEAKFHLAKHQLQATH
jgi:hypothetical protein